MTEDTEESCLVRSPMVSNYSTNLPYTDGSPFGIENSAQEPQNPPTTANHRGSTDSEDATDWIDYNDEILLSQFHADAIKQAGQGKFQFLAAIILGCGLSGHILQTISNIFVLPSAEIEFCLDDKEKKWLSGITLLGIAYGALLWGGMAGQSGRRKILLTCLGVSAVFSVVAAFMPTYGPFMMARFCAAFGIGGVLPVAAVYLCEVSPVNSRTLVLTIFTMVGVLSGYYAVKIAVTIMPTTGKLVILESKEHFSPWHKYLLIMSIPTLLSVLGLFWLPESPRWLLQAGREVEALSVYQKIYRENRVRGEYTLTELELPGPRQHRHHIPPTVLSGMIHGFKSFFKSFFHLFNKQYVKKTMVLTFSWVIGAMVCHGLLFFIQNYRKESIDAKALASTSIRTNRSYDNLKVLHDLEYRVYFNSTFTNCTFQNMLLNHVEFSNCSFYDNEFVKVKSSKMRFISSYFENVKFIGTDFVESRNFINCTENNTEVNSMTSSCIKEFDYNIDFDNKVILHMFRTVMTFILFTFFHFLVSHMGRTRVAIVSLTMTLIPLMGMMLFRSKAIPYFGSTATALIIMAMSAILIVAIENYPTSMRSSALGVIICAAHIGAMISEPIYGLFHYKNIETVVALSALLTIVPIPLQYYIIKDPCVLL